MAPYEKPTDDVAQHQEVVHQVENDPSTSLAAVAAAKGQTTTGYESMTVWETIKAFKICCLVCFAAAFSAATDGYQIALIGNIVANPGFVEQFGTIRDGNGKVALDSPILSAWASVGNVGQIIGMVSLPFLSGQLGRKAAMYALWFVLAISVAVECVAREWQTWLGAKLLGGVGVGCMQTTIPTYISEVAPTRVRGTFLTCYSLWWITGQFFAPVALQVIGQYDPMNFRLPIYTQWSQIGLMLIVYLCIPESPAWCLSMGSPERARKSLQFLYKDAPDFDIDHHCQVTLITLEHEREVAARLKCEKWYSIFRGVDGFRTIVSCCTLMAQMFIGMGLFFTYGSYFYQQAGMDDPFMATCITSGISILASLIVVYFSETIGRRPLATWGTTICWACNVFVGILGVVPQVHATHILLVLFAVFWNIGLVANTAVGYGYIGEISSQRLRHFTAGFAAASTCVVGVGLNFLIAPMISASEWNWGLKTCWFFAGTGAICTAAVWLLVPETSGRSPAELDELFERKIKPWQFRQTTTATQDLIEESKRKTEQV
ncbi:hypothetical protein CDV31_013136 [Fusarium ambrosium]|uniref:Major facilitator superfamily (MFS) profile domain-containing protein n=1 Tax=Fusarium ambrosium TaxID=131363 RepID=A0A428T5C5_9HYPO|nr:hypothetical protein CDV31_013136 [Fusarium ambrosium]